MQTIEAKVEVKDDRVMSVQLPTELPIGEYDVVLVLSQRSASLAGAQEAEEALARRWEQWFEQVEQVPLLDHPAAGDFQQHLVEKYRQQGLEL
jgi:hypothetical protein